MSACGEFFRIADHTNTEEEANSDQLCNQVRPQIDITSNLFSLSFLQHIPRQARDEDEVQRSSEVTELAGK